MPTLTLIGTWEFQLEWEAMLGAGDSKGVLTVDVGGRDVRAVFGRLPQACFF